MNPNRKVPVLVDLRSANGPPTVIFESAAILIYLAEQFRALLPCTEPARTTAIQWLMIQACSVGPMLGQLNHFTFAVTDNAYAHDRYRREAERLYRLLNQRLGQTPYLGGEAYSIADIATYPWVLYLERHGFDWQSFPHLDDWRQRIGARPAVSEGMKAIEAVETADAIAFEAATPEDRDRFFGRR